MTLLAVARYVVFYAVLHAPTERTVEEPAPWRLVEKRCLHVGVRPATDGSGVAVTVQISGCWPF